MRAVVLVRSKLATRIDIVCAGLTALGYETLRCPDTPPAPAKGDVAVSWNLIGVRGRQALQWKAEGGRLLVMENGYAGHDEAGRPLLALAENEHNGAGTWPLGPDGRWAGLGLPLHPWRESGDGHVLVTAQRGIGSRRMASPPGWAEHAAERLSRLTRRAIRIRPHPQDRVRRPSVSLADDLRDCHAVVTWSSAAGVQALLTGVPVFYEAPRWILSGAALRDLAQIETPWRGDRLPHLDRVAWAQWREAEIANGFAFHAVLLGKVS